MVVARHRTGVVVQGLPAHMTDWAGRSPGRVGVGRLPFANKAPPMVAPTDGAVCRLQVVALLVRVLSGGRPLHGVHRVLKVRVGVPCGSRATVFLRSSVEYQEKKKLIGQLISEAMIY